MANLLPALYKKDVRREYKFRRIVVGIVLLAALMLIATAFLVPSYIVSSAKHAIVSQEIDALKGGLTQEQTNTLKKTVDDTNQKIKLLSRNIKKTSVYDTLLSVIDEKTSAVKIHGIVYSVDSQGERVSVSGVARDRQSLLAFTKALEANTEFEKVDLPISNFVKEENIDFSLSIILAKQ